MTGALGIAKGSGDRAHHIISVNLIENENVQRAIDEGFDFNGIVNGIPIDKAKHTGFHPKYDNIVNDLINSEFSNPDNVGRSAREILEGVSGGLKEILEISSEKINKVFD